MITERGTGFEMGNRRNGDVFVEREGLELGKRMGSRG